MKQFVAKRPWILVVVAFFVLISAWSVLISIALNNQPEKVPLQHEIATTPNSPAGNPDDARD